MTQAPDPLNDPELRRRNIKTALFVACLPLGIMIIALIRFTVWGLPQDKNTYEQQQQEQSATGPAPQSTKDANP